MARTINFTAVQAILDSVWDDLKGAVASGGYLPESQQALMGLAFNLFILMYQLRTFCPDDDALRTALKECSGYDYFQYPPSPYSNLLGTPPLPIQIC